jgi:hypothetical protein
MVVSFGVPNLAQSVDCPVRFCLCLNIVIWRHGGAEAQLHSPELGEVGCAACSTVTHHLAVPVIFDAHKYVGWTGRIWIGSGDQLTDGLTDSRRDGAGKMASQRPACFL